MTVTKMDLTNHLYDTMGFRTAEASELGDLFFDTIRQTLARGEEVKLSGFGNFGLRDKRARPGRNPRFDGGLSCFRPAIGYRPRLRPDLSCRRSCAKSSRVIGCFPEGFGEFLRELPSSWLILGG